MTTRKLFDRHFDAVLFDMDGTLINSIAAAERAWSTWAKKFNLHLPSFLPTIHGKQAITTITELALPGANPEEEAALITAAEIADVEGIHPIEGALALLAALEKARWAIVTSSPRQLAHRRLDAAGIAHPTVLITAEDVRQGKPSPEGFALAASRLGVSPDACLAVEDSAAGIEAAASAGCTVLVISETHKHPIKSRHPIVANYAGLRVRVQEDGGISLELRS